MTPRSPRVGYVLKMYPRFSETFIVHEILQQEAVGTHVEIFSLRLPIDGRFHEALARVQAPVTYLSREHKASLFWSSLREAAREVPTITEHLDELLAAPEDEALAAVELAGAIRRSGLEHLHAHFGSIAADVARLAARLTGITYSFTAHAKDIFHEEVDPAGLATKLREAHTTVTVSDFNRTHLRAEFGEDAERVVRLYNSVDLEAFPFDPKGVAPGPARVAAVGRLVEKKGFGDLLTAVATLVDEGRDVHLDLVGTGPLEPVLREQVRTLGLGDRVTMHGALPQGRVREIVADAAVFAAPCVIGADGNRDGLPTVLLEALALGTPAVSTPVTGIPEIVRHEETGLLVPESDPGALAAALARTLDEPEAAAERARAARSLLEADFDFRDHAVTLQGIFREAISSRARLAGHREREVA
ncbi:MAG TPA: glycosyltransferase [Candidatus Janibacter merdipullorum]|nr:glycosyltransferase [Candidatus Janibacter merdipullorum]